MFFNNINNFISDCNNANNNHNSNISSGYHNNINFSNNVNNNINKVVHPSFNIENNNSINCINNSDKILLRNYNAKKNVNFLQTSFNIYNNTTSSKNMTTKNRFVLTNHSGLSPKNILKRLNPNSFYDHFFKEDANKTNSGLKNTSQLFNNQALKNLKTLNYNNSVNNNTITITSNNNNSNNIIANTRYLGFEDSKTLDIVGNNFYNSNNNIKLNLSSKYNIKFAESVKKPSEFASTKNSNLISTNYKSRFITNKSNENKFKITKEVTSNDNASSGNNYNKNFPKDSEISFYNQSGAAINNIYKSTLHTKSVNLKSRFTKNINDNNNITKHNANYNSIKKMEKNSNYYSCSHINKQEGNKKDNNKIVNIFSKDINFIVKNIYNYEDNNNLNSITANSKDIIQNINGNGINFNAVHNSNNNNNNNNNKNAVSNLGKIIEETNSTPSKLLNKHISELKDQSLETLINTSDEKKKNNKNKHMDKGKINQNSSFKINANDEVDKNKNKIQLSLMEKYLLTSDMSMNLTYKMR